MPARLTLAVLAASLAACSSPTFHERARVTTFPNDLSRTLVLTVDYEAFTGEAKPGPVPGQTVRVTSPAGKRLTCTFRKESWRLDGPGTCEDDQGRLYDMVIDRVINPI